MSAPRIALLGAFSFPAPQGSQVFARDQAEALARAGAQVCVVCYGHGVGEPPEGVERVRIPAALSPRSYRSGLHARKPVADAALALRLAQVMRRQKPDAILAHNAEAALVALLARATPTLYVAHTLQEEELSAYGPSSLAGLLTRAGAAIDRTVARRVAATIALGDFAAGELGRHARGPVEVLPPGVVVQEPPGAEEVARACARHAVKPGEFVLYAGNLDAYQELEVLRAAAARLPERVFLVASHASAARDLAPLRSVVVSAEEVRPLTHGAAVAVATRQRRGGFPIKLLNYMEAGRAIVAREQQTTSLVDDCNARLLPPNANAAAFATALESLLRDPARAAALGAAARATAAREHDWQRIARDTLSFVERVRATRRSP